MLFFFNIIEGRDEIPDPEGTELANEAAAQAEALEIAAELLREFPIASDEDPWWKSLMKPGAASRLFQ